MGIITVRKTQLSEAIQINSPEEEAKVLEWLKDQVEAASGQRPDETFTADFEDLKKKHVYFMRDHGSPIVYITSAPEFLSFFEEVSEEELNDPFADFKLEG